MKIGFSLIILLLAFLFACKPSNAYLEMEQRELTSGVRHDSLFLGLKLGMPAKDFYDHCWEMNKKGIIQEGAANTSVQYDVTTFKHDASMNFYPGFHEEKVAEMPLLFAYDAWAPWNRHLRADSLQPEVLTLMEDWFGQGFLEIKNPKDKEDRAFVKVDGNRRISIYKKDEQSVKVDIVDLLIKQKLDSIQAISNL